jgi:NADPH:quinone reductase-like Zn-dependent oxidoreductase
MKPGAILVVVGGPRANRPFGPLGHVIGCKLASILTRQQVRFFIAKLDQEGMETLRELLEAGKLTSVVDSVYPLDRLADALDHISHGHPSGKIVVTVP